LVRVDVLAVGRELLIGRTLNTNAHWIGKRLALMGTMIKLMVTADDDRSEISRALTTLLTGRPNFLVVLGGLGPTPDDMTLDGVASALRRRMFLNRKAFSLIKAHYARRGMADVKMTPARRKMSVLPEDAEPLANEEGTAPGVRLEYGGSIIFCLPGVPVEMRSIFRRSVEPEIRARVGDLHRKLITLKVEGIYESALAPIIQRQLNGNPDVYIKSHPRGIREGVSRIELDIATVSERSEDAEVVSSRIACEMTKAIKERGGVVRSVKGLG
jgi:molybdenum cofactor synthesis domain-containing protein